MLTGCPNLGGSHNSQDSSTNGDAVTSVDSFNINNVELPFWQLYVTMDVQAPKGLQVVNKIFVAESGIVNECVEKQIRSDGCFFSEGSSISSYSIQTATEEKTYYAVRLLLKNYMFVKNKGIKIGLKTDKKDYKISKDDWKPDEWGLAPQGTYTLDNDDNKEVQVTTTDGTESLGQEQKIRINFEGPSGVRPAGGYLTSYNTWEFDNGEVITHGEISDNLLLLTVTTKKHSDPSYLNTRKYYRKF